MRRKATIAAAVAGVLLIFLVGTALAIQFGEPDGNDHPHVGLWVFDVNGVPAFRCSGTLLSPTVLLTAGHCTFFDADFDGTNDVTGGRVWFESDVDPLVCPEEGPFRNCFPFRGGTSIEAKEIRTHPDYVDAAFFLHDAGIVILKKPVKLSTYGTLADIGLLDEIATRRGQQENSFTVVGYGLQSVVPTLQADLVRYRGEVQLVDVNGTAGIPAGTSASFTNNPGKGNGEGGTCLGDSGGPIFHGDSSIIAAITSFGLNLQCAGSGGGYRVDTVDDQAWINTFLD